MTEEKKQIYVPTDFVGLDPQSAHGSFMLPWPGIQCNFWVDPKDTYDEGEWLVADIEPMAQELEDFLKSDEPLMPFLSPFLPGRSYLTRFGAQQVWAVMPGWGKTRVRPRSDGVEYADGKGTLIDRATGLPVVAKTRRN